MRCTLFALLILGLIQGTTLAAETTPAVDVLRDRSPYDLLGNTTQTSIFGKTFGGTFWNSDSMRWEAIEDSVWTFDTGVGSHFQHTDQCKNPALHASMEGWTGLDLSEDPIAESNFRRLSVSDFAGAPDTCVGSPAGLGGSYSLWVGALPSEALGLCFLGGMGYGNNWNSELTQEFTYDDTDSLRLSFDITVDLEDDFDFLSVFVDTTCSTDGSGDVWVAGYTGVVSGSQTITLTEGDNLRSDAGCIRVKFQFFSDGAFSDQDGEYESACSAALDNILVTTVPYGGALNAFSDFETGTDGWINATCLGGGDFSRLEDLSTLPVSVPGCATSDSVLVFYDPDTGGHDLDKDNVAMSPWIDLKRAGAVGLSNRIVEMDVLGWLDLQRFVFLALVYQYYPYTCPVTGTTTTSPVLRHEFVVTFGAPGYLCRRVIRDLSSEIPATAEQVRIGVGPTNLCDVPFWTPQCDFITDTTPYIDNVVFLSRGTIQAAIDAAAPGDTVHIGPGDYSGTGNQDLDFGGKNLTILGAGIGNTIIRPALSSRGFIFDEGEDASSLVCGLTIRGGGGNVDRGGGAWIRNGSSPTFQDVEFVGCRADTGGGILVDEDSGVTVEDCTFDGGNGMGAGIGVLGSSSGSLPVQITNTTFKNNTGFGGRGGGVYAERGQFENCDFDANEAELGGGLYLVYPAELDGGNLTNNKASLQGGGVSPSGAAAFLAGAVVRNITATGNISEGDGGGITMTFGVIGPDVEVASVLSHSTVAENAALNGAGGGILVANKAVVDSCTVQGNDAFTGGGISGGGCSLGLFSEGSKPALIPDPCPTPPLISNTVITGNRALFGAGVSSLANIGFSLLSCTVAGNAAYDGGGAVWVPSSSPGGQSGVRAERSIFWDNCVGGQPGLAGFADTSGTVELVCCAYDTSAAVTGPGALVLSGPQVVDDPLFCSPLPCSQAPTVGGDYSLASNSPCLSTVSPCAALIGALDQGCGVLSALGPVAPVPVLRAAPNPSQANVEFHFAPGEGQAAGSLKIFDLRGRLVRDFVVTGESDTIVWDGKDRAGHSVAPGVYFARGNRGSVSLTVRIVRIP